MSAMEIIEQMRRLPADEKRQVVEQIWTEFGAELDWADPDLSPEQTAELDRRLAEFEQNPHQGIPWDTIKAELREKYGWQ